MNKTYDWWLDMSDMEFYAWYDKIFSDDELNLLEELFSDHDLRLGEIQDSNITATDIRNSNIEFIESSDEMYKWIFQRLTGIINDANEKFFKFELNRIETLQYTVYNTGQFYKDHLDLGYKNPNQAVRKLSFTVQLTDPSKYKGGDLLLKHGTEPEIAKRERGAITFFPSYILHEVTPVTEGVRKSLVGWVTGPRWR